MRNSIKFTWALNYKSCIFVTIFLPTTLALGLWQLNRGDEKQSLEMNMQHLKTSAPLSMQQAEQSHHSGLDLNYYPITIHGSLLTKQYFFLDNQVMRKKAGYHLITPLQYEKYIVLVNRGWLPAANSRDQLPIIDDFQSSVEVSGILYRPKHFTLQEQQINSNWPKRIQAIDINKLNEYFSRPIFPYIILINPESTLAFNTSETTIDLNPQRHYGYAFQYFSLAIALTLLALWSNSNLFSYLRQKF